MKPFVAFDLDEVILNLRDGCHAALARRLGGYPHWSQWTDFLHMEKRGVLVKQFLDMIVEECILETATIEPGAWEAINWIRDLGFRTAVVTARGYHPRGEQITNDWLEQHDIVMDEVVVVPFGKTKVDALRDLGDVAAYIDDHADHIAALHGAGVGGMLVLHDRPWNQNAGASYFRVPNLTVFSTEVELMQLEVFGNWQ
jgi:hypothetical protein